jgi:hypothetical protein
MHVGSKQTEVSYPISEYIYDQMKFNYTESEKNGKPILNLGWGEPNKANGFETPSVIEEAVIEVIK